MPRQRKVRKNKRNENLLTTQLMRISLRVDDHIYNDRSIAAADAARFLQEIATLKLQCLPTNARALQVIEKLTRLLSNILTEEDGVHGHDSSSYSYNKPFQINTEFAGSASPVYSLPDEDRNDIYEQVHVDLNPTRISDDDETIHKQINICHGQNIATEFTGSASAVYALTDENKINDIHKQELEMNNLNTNHISRDQMSHKETYTTRGQINLNTSTSNKRVITTTKVGNNTYLKNNFDNGQVIDITNDSDIDEANETVAVSNEPNISIEHVNFGVSNMAIHDKVGNQTKLVHDDVSCSQSVLENNGNDHYHNNKATANNKNRVMVENKSYNEKNAKACVINKVNNYFQKQTPLTVMPSQDIVAPTILADSEPTQLDLNQYNKTVTQKAILLGNKMAMKKKAGDNKGKPKKRTKKNLKPKENKAAHNCVHNDLNVTTICKYVTNKTNNKENRPKSGKTSRKLKKVHEIYDENVENDLSWVENLRYVRVVSPSEYDPALSMLQDDFWDNFELPGTWNDLDFEV